MWKKSGKVWEKKGEQKKTIICYHPVHVLDKLAILARYSRLRMSYNITNHNIA